MAGRSKRLMLAALAVVVAVPQVSFLLFVASPCGTSAPPPPSDSAAGASRASGVAPAQRAFSLLSSYFDFVRGGLWNPDAIQPPQRKEDKEGPVASNASAATNGGGRPERPRTLHVLYGLSGNKTAFMDEFVVSLKSVLLNAPVDSPMHVHLIVDDAAHSVLTNRIFPQLGLNGSIWRNSIVISLYPVSEQLKGLHIRRIYESLPNRNVTVMKRVGSGALFRIFAHEILPADLDSGGEEGDKGAGTALYLDNDVVAFANLAEVMSLQDSKYMYQAGTSNDLCSGFMVLNLRQFPAFFSYLSQVRPEHLGRQFDDQAMLNAVKRHLRGLEIEWEKKAGASGARNGDTPQQSHNGSTTVPLRPPFPVVGDLPASWHVHLAHGYSRGRAQRLGETHPEGFGMLHFNGLRSGAVTWWAGRDGVMRYCDEACRSDQRAEQAVRETWNLAEYYVHLPFAHAKRLGRSLVSGHDGGTPLVVRTTCPAVMPDCGYI
jgi:hypothetical protein